MITDTADESSMGGPLKIDSLQNLMTLRRDIHAIWDNYELGVNPDVSSTCKMLHLMTVTAICLEQLLHNILQKWTCRSEW
jgi:HNH endonuclease